MTFQDMLTKMVLYGLLGLIGQGVRVIIGLKKLQEESTDSAQKLAVNPKQVYDSQFDVRQLWLSLFIGFIAGCLASLVHDEPKPVLEAENKPNVYLAIIAAGYAGTDFIEGAFKKIFPGK